MSRLYNPWKGPRLAAGWTAGLVLLADGHRHHSSELHKAIASGADPVGGLVASTVAGMIGEAVKAKFLSRYGRYDHVTRQDTRMYWINPKKDQIPTAAIWNSPTGNPRVAGNLSGVGWGEGVSLPSSRNLSHMGSGMGGLVCVLASKHTAPCQGDILQYRSVRTGNPQPMCEFHAKPNLDAGKITE